MCVQVAVSPSSSVMKGRVRCFENTGTCRRASGNVCGRVCVCERGGGGVYVRGLFDVLMSICIYLLIYVCTCVCV